MLVNFNDKNYEFDLEEITVQQAKVIQAATGFTLNSLQDGLENGDANALSAVYWLMLAQNGEQANIQTLDFKVFKFGQAVQAAADAEAEKEKAAEQEASENPTS